MFFHGKLFQSPPSRDAFLAMPLGLQATAPPLAPTGRARKALNGLAGIRRTEHNCLKLDLLHIAGVIQPNFWEFADMQISYKRFCTQDKGLRVCTSQLHPKESETGHVMAQKAH
jgi:hypothetical protein